MARMHARRRGKSCSVRPYRKQAPAWSNTDTKAIEKIILDLRKEGASSAKIGLVLRDRYGVPDVKLADRQAYRGYPESKQGRVRDPGGSPGPDGKGTGSQEAPYREQEGPAQQAPAPAGRVQGPPARQVLYGNQETARRLGLQAGEYRDPAVQVRFSIIVLKNHVA